MNELILVDNGLATLDQDTAVKIADFERTIKAIKEQEEALKNLIIEEMEAKGIIKLTTPEITISYVAPTVRESFDSKKLRADNPDLYDSYVSLTPVKASVRIKVK